MNNRMPNTQIGTLVTSKASCSGDMTVGTTESVDLLLLLTGGVFSGDVVGIVVSGDEVATVVSGDEVAIVVSGDEVAKVVASGDVVDIVVVSGDVVDIVVVSGDVVDKGVLVVGLDKMVLFDEDKVVLTTVSSGGRRVVALPGSLVSSLAATASTALLV